MKKLLPLITVFICSTIYVQASVVLNIFAQRLQNQSGTTIAAGSLLQLVDLGADGVFNQINIADGTGGSGSLTQWVSGDDTLIDQAFGSADFSSTRAFDLNDGADNSIGQMDRPFALTIAASTKIGLRWFPSLNATTVQSNFGTFTLANGTRYGEYTRQSSPINGGNLWVVPADGSLPETFDALATGTAGGANPESDGLAAMTVVPEPSSLLLGIAGIACFSIRRKRK